MVDLVLYKLLSKTIMVAQKKTLAKPFWCLEASGGFLNPSFSEVHPPLYIDFLSEACLGVYTLELVAIFALHGKKALESRAVLFDIFTISCSNSLQ